MGGLRYSVTLKSCTDKRCAHSHQQQDFIAKALHLAAFTLWEASLQSEGVICAKCSVITIS